MNRWLTGLGLILIIAGVIAAFLGKSILIGPVILVGAAIVVTQWARGPELGPAPEDIRRAGDESESEQKILPDSWPGPS